MSNENGKLQELLEWITSDNADENDFLLVGVMKEKIQSLMSEATVDPSEWQVGDRVYNEKYSDRDCIFRVENHECDSFTIPEYDKMINKEYWVNIDAERRALQAEIDRLQKECIKAQKDPWCYDLEKAPKDGEYFIIELDQGVYGKKYYIVHWSDRVKNWMDYEGYVFSFEKWMPIAESKGGA